MIQAARIPSASRNPGPDASACLADTLRERWRRYRKAYGQCRKEFSEDSVHQLRVETRRLIALLDLLDSLIHREELDALRRALKKSFRRLARLRDTQVQLLFVEKHRRHFPEIRPFAKALRRLEKRLIRNLDKRVHQTGLRKMNRLATGLRNGLVPDLAKAGLPSRGHTLLTRHARTAFNRVVTLRRRIDPDCPLTIHRTRVAFKRFRYLVELLHPWLPRFSLRRLQTMHDYQVLMGEIQDLEVLQHTLDQFITTHPDSAQTLNGFCQEIERQHQTRITRYLVAADKLFYFWPAKPRSPSHSPGRPKPLPPT
jgi:CHAD domain-containing protein